MKKFKRILSAILVMIALILSLSLSIPINAIDLTGTCGDDLRWSFNCLTRTLTISGSGAMKNYGNSPAPSSPFYPLRKEIKSVVIGPEVTTIGSCAFYECVALKSIVVPDSVKEISTYAFYGCMKLSEVELPDSAIKIGSGVFSNTGIYNDNSNWDGNVLYIDNYLIDVKYIVNRSSYTIKEGTVCVAYGAFRNCEYNDIIFPNTLEVICDYAFISQDMSDLVLPEGLKTIGVRAFYDCIYLDTVTMPQSIAKIAYEAFYCCGSFVMRCYKNSYVATVARSITPYVEYYCDHKFTNYVEDTGATCTENATKIAYCDKGCETVDKVMVEDSALGHSFVNYIEDNNATCTQNGTKTAKCKNCDKTDTVEIEGSALGHSFTNYVTINEVSCTMDGIKESLCDNGCGEKDIIIEEPFGHSLGEWAVIEEATYYTEGCKEQSCTVCLQVVNTEALPVLEYEGFPDVWENSWYAEGVEYCFKHGYIIGNDKGEFNPDGELTREQFVTILARVADANLSEHTESSFDDVKVDSWYGAAVIWANSEGLVNGIGNGKFGVGQPLSREQLAAMFFRYAEKQGLNIEDRADLSRCNDANAISDWALDASAWAIEAGILGSTSDTANLLSPKMTVTRAQAAKLFMSFDAYSLQ